MIGLERWRVTLGDWIGALAVSPDGALVAAGSLAGDAVVVGARTGEVLAKLDAHPLGVLALAWSPDGSTLAAGGQDGVVARYTRDGGRRAAPIVCDGWVADLAWCPTTPESGGSLAIAAGKAVVVADGNGRVERSDDVASTVTAVAWSPDGRRVGGTSYGSLSWYEPGSAPMTAPVRQYRWKGSLLSLVVAPDGRWACAGAQDSTIQLWKLWSGDDLSMSGYPAKIEHLAFRTDSRWMASACLGEITVWDFGGRGPKGRRPAVAESHNRHVTALAFQPGGDLLASAAADGRVVLWPSPTKEGHELRPVTDVDGGRVAASLAWLPSGDGLVSGWADGSVDLRPVG